MEFLDDFFKFFGEISETLLGQIHINFPATFVDKINGEIFEEIISLFSDRIP